MTPSQLRPTDLAHEVWLDLRSRPGRTALTTLGTLIGIAVLVSTLGLAASLAAQIAARFDALTATEVTVTPPGTDTSAIALPIDAPQRALRVNGTVAAATLSEIKNTTITGTPLKDPSVAAASGLSLFAASPDLGRVLY